MSVTIPQLIADGGQSNSEVINNDNAKSLGTFFMYAKHPPSTSGLTGGFYGGNWNGITIGVLYSSTQTYHVTLSYTNTAINYVVAHRTTGALSVSTSNANWNNSTTYGRVRMVTCSGGVVTDEEDWRNLSGGIFDRSFGSSVAANVPAVRYSIELLNTTDSDPGAGLLKFNNATPASATFLYVDDSTSDGVDLSTYFLGLGASGYITIQSVADAGEWAIFKWTAITDGTGYFKFAVTAYASLGTLDDADAVLVAFDSDASSTGGTVTSVDASGGVQTASGSPISVTGTIRGAHVVNAQTGTTYAIVAGDRGKRVTLANAASIAVSIAQAGTTGFEDGYFTYLEATGVGAVTLTPATSTINGAATLVLTSGTAAVLFSDGTNYRVFVIDAPGIPVNPQTGTAYTYLSGDRNKLVSHTNAAAIAGTLPQGTGAFGVGWYIWVQNRGAGTLTITPTTSTIDGAATLALMTNQGALIVSDGTNYYTMRGVAGAGSGSTQGRHGIFIAAGSMSPSVTGGCAAVVGVATAANQPDIRSADFDPATQEYAQFYLTMPKSWNEGAVTFAPVWSHAGTTVNFGVVWDLQAVAVSDLDGIAAAYGTAQTSTDTGGTTNTLYMGPESAAITVAGTPANEDTVFFRVSRVTANAGDTMAIDARLMGVVLYITTNADTDT